MKYLALAAALLFPALSIACEEHEGHHTAVETSSFAKINVLSQPKKDSETVKFRLAEVKTGKPITLAGLKEVHTKKLHLLVIDPTLEDYHHIHPQETKTKGVYSFEIPKTKFGYYRAYADITPAATGKQEYVPFIIGRENRMMPSINTAQTSEAEVDGYQFNLEFDKAPETGKASMGTIKITKDGEAVKNLEPVMGTFGHIVAFSNGGREVLHIHPMGKEPKSEKDRGGPELMFHMEPKSKGFTKIFAQVKINGKDIYAPFGVNVK